MPYAVEMQFDADGDAGVRKVWAALAEVGLSDLASSGASPHVTLAVWEQVPDVPAMQDALAELARGAASMPLTFASHGLFARPILFLAPLVTPPLLDLHARTHRALDPLTVRPWPYYLPGQWVPHCTLAMDLPEARAAEALAVARRFPVPIPVAVEHLALVEVKPFKVLFAVGLRK